MDWSPYFPYFIDSGPAPDSKKDGHETAAELVEATPRKLTQNVEVLDIGCGFGGLLMALSPLYPNTLMLGEPNPEPGEPVITKPLSNHLTSLSRTRDPVQSLSVCP